MKTFEIVQNYDEKIRITVGPDVRCTTNVGHFDGGAALSVAFTREEARYETETVAAFQNVRSVRLLDETVKVEVQEHTYEDAVMQATPYKTEWVDASKK